MAFGKRTTVVVASPARSRGWRNMGPARRRPRGAASAIASNKVMGGPKTMMTDLSTASGRRMSIAGAIIGEKFARFTADVKLGFYTMSHPLYPLQRVAAKERNMNVKAAARERRKVAHAVDVEMRKCALVRERRAARLQAAL